MSYLLLCKWYILAILAGLGSAYHLSRVLTDALKVASSSKTTHNVWLVLYT